MTAMGKGIRILALAAAMMSTAAIPALAETVSFKADLKPVAGTNSTASGTVTADYDTGTKKLTWRGRYRGLGTYATSANMHGSKGRVVVRLRSVDSPFEGTAIVSEKQAADLVGGRWFLLVRTAAFPDGELRGQLMRQ